MKEKPRIIATIEARMTSTRLPGKIMMTCLGKNMLEYMVGRVKKSKVIEEIVIATTVNETDDVIAHEAARLGVGCYRGSEENVMARVLEAAQSFGADIIVELTGDCPLMDPALIDDAVERYFNLNVDYLSNLKIEDFKKGKSQPLGYAVQVFSTAVLADAFSRTTDPLDLEHVSRYLYQHQDRYSVAYLSIPKSQRGPGMSVTLDTHQDFEVISRVIKDLSPMNVDFTIEDVVDYLSSQPEVRLINQGIGRVKV